MFDYACLWLIATVKRTQSHKFVRNGEKKKTERERKKGENEEEKQTKIRKITQMKWNEIQVTKNVKQN